MNNDEEYKIDVENTFINFLIVIENLHLTNRITSMICRSDDILHGFVYRNRDSLSKPKAILIR